MKPVYDPKTRKLKEDLARQLHDAGFGKREAFSDGDRVGFVEAGLINNKTVKAGELLSYLKKYGIDIHPINLSRSAKFYGIESPSSGRYILPSDLEALKKEWIKNQERAYGTTTRGREKSKERRELVQKLVASEKYNPSEIKNIIRKKYNVDMGNTIQKVINEQRKEGKNIPSAREGETSTKTKELLKDINLLNENKKIKNILSNPKFNFEKDYLKIFDEAKNTLKLNPSKTSYRLAALFKSYSEGKLSSDKNIISNSDKIYSSIAKSGPLGSVGSVLYRREKVEPGVASQIGKEPKFFKNVRNKITRYLPGENIYSTDELKNLISSYENKTGAYSVFVQGIKKDINLDKGRTIDKIINQVEKKLQNLDTKDVNYLDQRETIKNEYNKKVEQFTNKYNKDLKKGELPVRGLKLSFDSPKNSLARYDELKKIDPDLIRGVENIYNKYNYSFEVPKDVKIISEALNYVTSSGGKTSMEQRGKEGQNRVYFEASEQKNVPKYYETIRSNIQRYLPGLPFRTGAATLDYMMQNYLFNMPSADAALAASTWLIKNREAAEKIGKTINLVLTGQATKEDVKDSIDTFVKNTNFEDLVFSPAVADLSQKQKKAISEETVNSKTGEVRELKEPIKTADDLIKDQENFEFVSSEMPTQEYKSGGRVKFQEGTNLMNVLDNIAMEDMNRKLGIEFRGEIPKGIKFRTDLGTAGDPMGEARGDLTEQDVQIDDVLESQIFKIMLEKSKRDQEKLFYTKRNIEKMGGTRFIEDFPDQTEYLKAVGQDIASPRGLSYIGTKLLEGVVGGLEFLPGQAYTLAKGDLEFYQPVLPEKFGITSLAEKVKPDIRTSGLMAAGDIAKFTGEFADPFIAYGLTKKGIGAFKKTPDGVSKSDEILSEIDPTRRDVLKTGVAITGGAMAYPLAKKISLLEEAGKVAKVSRNINNAPFWFEDLINVVAKPENILKQSGTKKIYNNKGVKLVEDDRSIEITFETDNGLPAYIEYIKPGEIIDPKTGKIKKTPGDYQEYELVYRGEGDYYTKDLEEGINSGKGNLIRMSGNKVPKEESSKASRFADEQSAAEARMEADLDFLESQADEID